MERAVILADSQELSIANLPFNIQSNQKDEVEGFIQVLNKSKSEKNHELDNLNFYNQDNKIIVSFVLMSYYDNLFM